MTEVRRLPTYLIGRRAADHHGYGMLPTLQKVYVGPVSS